MKKLPSNVLSYFYISIAVFLWGSTAVVSELSSNTLSPIQIACFSMLISTVFQFILTIARGNIKECKNISKKELFISASMGFLSITIYQFFLQLSFSQIPPQEAFIINYTWPIITVILSWIILKSRITLSTAIGFLSSFLGVIILTLGLNIDGISFNLLGVTYSLIAALSFSLYSVLLNELPIRSSISPLLFTAFGSLFLVVIWVISGASIPSFDASEILSLVWLGVFAGGVGYMSWLKAVDLGNITIVSNIAYLVPVVSLILGVVFLKTPVNNSSIIGLLLVFTGNILPSVNKLRARLQAN